MGESYIHPKTNGISEPDSVSEFVSDVAHYRRRINDLRNFKNRCVTDLVKTNTRKVISIAEQTVASGSESSDSSVDPWRGHGSTQHILADVLGTGFGDPETLEYLRTGDRQQKMFFKFLLSRYG